MEIAAAHARRGPRNDQEIENTEQLAQAIEQMGRMQRTLDAYGADILPKNPRNFAVFAEGPPDEIRKPQAALTGRAGCSRTGH
jgi:hypothetical protein